MWIQQIQRLASVSPSARALTFDFSFASLREETLFAAALRAWVHASSAFARVPSSSMRGRYRLAPPLQPSLVAAARAEHHAIGSPAHAQTHAASSERPQSEQAKSEEREALTCEVTSEQRSCARTEYHRHSGHRRCQLPELSTTTAATLTTLACICICCGSATPSQISGQTSVQHDGEKAIFYAPEIATTRHIGGNRH